MFMFFYLGGSESGDPPSLPVDVILSRVVDPQLVLLAQGDGGLEVGDEVLNLALAERVELVRARLWT